MIICVRLFFLQGVEKLSIEKNTPNILNLGNEPYTIILNEILQGVRDPIALAVYCYLASQFTGWVICDKQLQNHFGIGRDKLKKRMLHLKELGLYEKNPIRNDKGIITSWRTNLNRKLQSTENQCTGREVNRTSSALNIQSMGNPVDGQSAPINTRVLEIQEKEEIQYLKPTVDSSNQTAVDYKGDDLFMAFYSNYPNKQKPRVAYKAFLKLKPDQALTDKLVRDVSARSANNWKDRPTNKIPHPTTYLNAHEWEGDIILSREDKTATAKADNNQTSWIENLGENF
jgi:viroplasmin and RNaseH domain-containing protein